MTLEHGAGGIPTKNVSGMKSLFRIFLVTYVHATPAHFGCGVGVKMRSMGLKVSGRQFLAPSRHITPQKLVGDSSLISIEIGYP